MACSTSAAYEEVHMTKRSLLFSLLGLTASPSASAEDDEYRYHEFQAVTVSLDRAPITQSSSGLDTIGNDMMGRAGHLVKGAFISATIRPLLETVLRRMCCKRPTHSVSGPSP